MIVSVISNEHQFREEFKQMGRGDQFTHDGLGLLFDYLDELSDDCGQQIELDVVGICCDYTENTQEDIARFHALDIDEVMDYLHENSIVVGQTAEGTIVYRQF
jgi:hypothetical protein